MVLREKVESSAQIIRNGFDEYRSKFMEITRRAKSRFERRNWHGIQYDSRERLELYKKRLEEVQKLPFTVADLNVDGHDVMSVYEVSPGPIIGKVLDALFAEVEAGTLPNEREALLSKLKDLKPTFAS